MVFCAEPAVHKVALPASPHVDDWRRFLYELEVGPLLEGAPDSCEG